MSKLPSKLIAGLARVVEVGKRPNLSKRLFVDVTGNRSQLGELGDTRGPEFESGREPYGTRRDVRFAGLVFVAFLLLVFAMFCLIIEYGWPLPTGRPL